MIDPGVGAREPGSSDADHSLAEWVADRLEAGEPIDEGSYAAAQPERAGRLRRLVAAMGRIDRLRGRESADESPPIGVLGDFRTVREIGRGGMGVVYEAVQLSLNRRVALKILPSVSADDPRRLRRFQVEAQAAACLNHPHIVPVYLVGAEGGVHFFAMQLIEGRTLAEAIAGGERLAPRAAAELGRQAAEALDYAHAQGVVHRDVKPSNLLIDGLGRLWVADFGLARVGESGDLTATGDLMGTLRYASPEQALGARGVVDHRTDVYSLGTTLYERLALRPAFDGSDRIDLLRRIADEEPRPLRRIDPTIPRDLETIVLKAMAKDPADRYPTARAVADDLGRFLDDRPILARPPGTLGRAARWSRRHRPAVAAAAVVLLAALVGLGVAAWWRYATLRRHNVELRSALDLADLHERSTHQLWYDSQMRLAQQSLASGQAEFAQELLEGLRPEPGRGDPRGFEWHYLRRVSHRDVSNIESDAFEMAVSPDGLTLAMCEARGVMRFWDLAAWRERGRARAHPAGVHGLCYSPDGRTLASWATGPEIPGQVTLWDPASALELAALPPIAGQVSVVAFSHDGRTLAFREGPSADSSRDRIGFWDLSPSPARPRPGADPVLCDVSAFSAGGRRLVMSDGNGPITTRDLATGRAVAPPPGGYTEIHGLGLSPDGRTVAVRLPDRIAFRDADSGRSMGAVATPYGGRMVFSPDGTRLVGLAIQADFVGGFVLIQGVGTDPRTVPLEGISGGGLQVAFSPDGATLAVGGVGLPATLCETSTGRKVAQFPYKTGSVRRVLFAPDGRSVIFASEDGRVRSWHIGGRPEPVDTLAGHPAEVWGLAYTPDGSALISAGDDHAIKLWDPRDGRLRATLEGHTALVASLAIGPDGTTLASAGFDRTVRLWDLPSGRPRAALRGHTDRVRAVAFSRDGRTIASAGSDDTVRLWDAASGAPLRTFEGHADTVRALAFHPGGALLVSSSDDRTIRAWDLAGAREPISLACPKHNAALAFSPDGTLLASGDDWGNVSIREVATWSQRTSVKGSDAPVSGLTFSPDGRTLAAACGDAKVRLWDPLTGQVTLVLDGHAQRVNAVAFAPDGRSLASAGHDGAIKLWRSADPSPSPTAEAPGPRRDRADATDGGPPRGIGPGPAALPE